MECERCERKPATTKYTSEDGITFEVCEDCYGVLIE